jgi:hypothetical protein
LKRLHQEKRERTVRLVKAAVDQLIQEGKTVTLEAIGAQSRELDPEGKGIKKAAIIGNAEAHAYYRKHSVPYRSGRGQQRRKGRQLGMATTPSRIHPGRDVQRVRQRYLLQRKEDLVDRLLAVEQELGKAQQQLASLQFEALALQQQDRPGHRPLVCSGLVARARGERRHYY